MSHPDPKRLGGDLLASARRDAPSADARARVAGTLGLGVGVTAAVVTTKAVAAGTATVSTTTKMAGAGLGLWAKVAGVAAVTLAVGGGAVVATTRGPASAPSTPDTPPRAPTAASAPGMSSGERARLAQIPAPEPLPPIAPSGAEPTSEQTASAPSARPLAARVPRGESNAEEGPSLLTREVRAIELARAALVRGDANAALAALDQHDRDFARGPMQTEADVVRIDALVAKGDDAGAKRLAEQLLAREPAGAHARHLRSVAGADRPGH